MQTASPPNDTRQRLLQAAGEVFADVGYRAATVRDIVARAEANIAAVNYHFGDKEGLYAAVLEHSSRAAIERHPPDGGLAPDAPPEVRLRAFVRAMLLRLFDEGRGGIHGRLMAWEMVSPTAALEPIVRRVFRPLYERLLGIVREIAGAGVPPHRVELCARSVIGQCLFYRHSAAVISLLEGHSFEGEREVESLADHVTEFSLGGIRALARRKTRRRR